MTTSNPYSVRPRGRMLKEGRRGTLECQQRLDLTPQGDIAVAGFRDERLD